MSRGAAAGMGADVPKISPAGSGALLLDAADGPFSPSAQQRVWSVAAALHGVDGVRETVPGMNNLLVVFDALTIDAVRVGEAIMSRWRDVEPREIAGKTVEIPVVYGGEYGEDLEDWAAHCGLSVDEAVTRHSGALYSVAAVGAMPGFPYLSGLDPALARPRRAVPRAKVLEGSVIIGGAQAGIMPQTAPSGWHILGHTDLKLFEASAEPPALLQPGDTVRFVPAGLAS